MTTIKANVKWGKEKYEVEVNTADPPLVFKAQLLALTGVEIDRQKLVVKGKTVGDETWDGIQGLKDGVQFMLMGSAEALPVAPQKKQVFIEDLSESDLRSAQNFPTGLKNLGNTCYMNATLQCFRTVPEFRDVLRKYRPPQSSASNNMNPGEVITLATRELFSTMDRVAEYPPMLMVHTLRNVFPQFDQKDEHDRHQQQDANECWVELLRMYQQQLPGIGGPTSGESSPKSFINQYMAGQFEVTLTCKDPEASEEPVKSFESFLQLSCYLPTEVKYLQLGLKTKLKEEIEKNCPSLGRNAMYERTTLISRAPGYLCVQMVRFEYKERQNVNAKIMKDVKFTMSLDIFDLCTVDLQNRLLPMRNRFKAAEDKKLAHAEAVKKGEADASIDPKAKTIVSYSFPDDPGSNNSGFHELQAVLTHKGRASNSGHYVAWVKHAPNHWIKCDDDEMSSVTDEDIIKLSGGGDWHCAYLLLYGPKILEEVNEDVNSLPTVQSIDMK